MDTSDIQKGMAFATHFAKALIELKAASKDRRRAVLTFQEAQAVIEGLQLLRKGPDGNRN